jgi:hypothetical protein
MQVRPLGAYDEFSPDGAEFVTLLPQPTDSVAVVFTQSVDDVTGATRFQVTHYAPPPSPTPLARAEPADPMSSTKPRRQEGGTLCVGIRSGSLQLGCWYLHPHPTRWRYDGLLAARGS